MFSTPTLCLLDLFTQDISKSLPLQLLLVLAASFLIGLVMEGRKLGGKRFSPGGVRTFPLICLSGFLLALLSKAFPGGFLVGMALLGVWLAMLYRTKIAAGNYGMTTEMYALAAYLLGALAAVQMWWLVAALTVLLVMLQELKDPLERLVTRMPAGELASISKFVLLTAVILPVMPDELYTPLRLNPQKIWLMVVAVATVSYAGYLLRRVIGAGRHDLLLTGLLGGAYSSTATTVVLARRAAEPEGAHARGIVGGILAASGMMNVRLLVLVGLFSRPLMEQLLVPLLAAAAVGILAGALIALPRARIRTGRPGDVPSQPAVRPARSPLELPTALGFAALFAAMLALTNLASARLGGGGLYTLGALSGLGAVDPFILSLTQRSESALGVAALASILAASANHVAKGFYAMLLMTRPASPGAGRRRTGVACLIALAALAAVTLAAWAVGVHFGWTVAP